MAKLFYTIDEASTKLGKSTDELQSMVSAGQLEPFRMHDVLHFKRAAIDQLVVEDLGDIDLSISAGSGGSNALGSGSDRSGELRFDDSALGKSAGGSSGLDLGLDLGLDESLSLADSGAPSSRPASPPPAPDGSSIADFGGSGSQVPLSLADSAAKSSIRPPSAPPADQGSGMDLGLDLDLGLDAPKAASGAGSAGGAFGLGDSGATARPASGSDQSGSMAARSGTGGSAAAKVRGLADSGVGAPPIGASDSGGLNLETVGSGSGMLDLAGDSDQSTMGAALLEDPGDGDGIDEAVGGAEDLFAGPSEGDGLDEGAMDSAPVAVGGGGGIPLVAAASTAVDTAASGLGIGLLAGAFAAIILAAVIVVGTRMGGGSALAGMVTGDLAVWLGALAGGTVIAGGIGFFVGRAIE